MNPKSKSEYRQEVIENGRVEDYGQSQEEWQEEVEDEAKFAAEIQDDKSWDDLPD